MKRRHLHPQRPLASAAERAADQVLIAIRSCARRLYTAAWSCDLLAPTVTGFVADLRSGYSTYDLPPEELREAAFAAGELTAIAGRTVADALEYLLQFSGNRGRSAIVTIVFPAANTQPSPP